MAAVNLLGGEMAAAPKKGPLTTRKVNSGAEWTANPRGMSAISYKINSKYKSPRQRMARYRVSRIPLPHHS